MARRFAMRNRGLTNALIQAALVAAALASLALPYMETTDRVTQPMRAYTGWARFVRDGTPGWLAALGLLSVVTAFGGGAARWRALGCVLHVATAAASYLLLVIADVLIMLTLFARTRRLFGGYLFLGLLAFAIGRSVLLALGTLDRERRVATWLRATLGL